jgi:hypothetical protein
MPANQVYTPDKLTKAYKMYYEEGMSAEEIGKTFNVSGRTALNWIDKEIERLDGKKGKKKKSSFDEDLKAAVDNKQNSSSHSGEKSKKEIIMEWLDKNPEGNHIEFVKDTGVSVHKTHFNATKGKWKKTSKKYKPPSPIKTKADYIKEWLAKNPDGLFKQFNSDPEIKKIKVHPSQFNSIKRNLKASPKPSKKRKTNGVRKKRTNGINNLASIQTIQDLTEEVEFLRWWNQGERKGFVEKLFIKIENPDT